MYGNNEPFLTASIQAGKEALYQLDIAAQERDKARSHCRWYAWTVAALLAALVASWGYGMSGGFCG